MFTEKIITKVGYLETTLPFPYYNQLLANINENPPTESYSRDLAGQIENEKGLDLSYIPNEIKNIIVNGCHQYVNLFGHSAMIRRKFKNYSFQFSDLWINFQKAGEYNPIHDHGGDMVFVIWLQIPYNLENELNHPSCKNSNAQIASSFQFANIINPYSDRLNSIIPVDKSYEGKMILFHANMFHQVYPFFTSDEYRISMSGNLQMVFEK